MYILTAKEMQEIDRTAIEGYDIPGLTLMENAGRGVAEIILKEFRERLDKGVLVLAGPGNNGGDGFVVARYLHQAGIKTEILILSRVDAYTGDAAENLKAAKASGLNISVCHDEESVLSKKESFFSSGVIVDAIFGIGLSRNVGGRFLRAIELSNMSQSPVISIDIPSGLSTDTGKPLGASIMAEVTATMAFPKIGMFFPKAGDYVGKLKVVDIGIPQEILEQKVLKTFLLDKEMARGLFRPRPAWGHKGTFGHLLVLAGSRGKTGAGALVAMGALRSGAGLVTAACPRSIQPIYSQKLTEAMTEGLPETEEGTISRDAAAALNIIMKKKKAIAIGPGIGLNEETREVVLGLIKEAPIPMVIDADALTAIGKDLEILKACPHPRIITPHPGEMARLTGLGIPEIEDKRMEVVRDLSKETGKVVVLKGYRTLVAAPDGRLAVNSTGNQGMASGGMGDVLTGIIGGLLAQGYSPWEAACLGVFSHGLSGDILYKEIGPYGYLAGEVADNLPRVWGRLSS